MTKGEVIKSLREQFDMSQTELAEKLNTTKQTIYKYENNIITNIPTDKIEKMAAIFNVSEAYLMGWSEEYTVESSTSKSNGESSIYIEPEAAEMAQQMFERPELRALFRASKNATKDDIETVKNLLEKLNK